MVLRHVAQKKEAENILLPAKLWKLSFGIVRDAYRSFFFFLEKAETINAASYVPTLNKLRRALREERPKKKTVILQHENARPHTARLTFQTIQKNDWEPLYHSH
jgi:hypothetical protein